MKTGDIGIQCTKNGYVVGYGILDELDEENYDYFPMPKGGYNPKKDPDWKMHDENRMLQHKFVDGKVSIVKQIPPKDNKDYYGFRAKYTVEQRLELQDEAIDAILSGNAPSNEVMEYLAVQKKAKVAEHNLRSDMQNGQKS